MNVYVSMHASANIHISTCAFMHVCLYTCMHVCMGTCRCVENMMGMQTFIGYVGNFSIMHDLLQRMRSYIFLTMIAYVVMATVYMQKMKAMRYIDTNTHISLVLYSTREFACMIIFAHLQVLVSIILEQNISFFNK